MRNPTKNTGLKRGMMIGLLALSLSAQGQTGRPKGERPPMDAKAMASQETERVTKDLGLTEAQVPKVLEVNEKYAKLQQDRMENERKEGGKPDPATKRTEMEKLGKAKDAEIKPILTAAQWSAYQQKPKRPQGGGPQKGDSKREPRGKAPQS